MPLVPKRITPGKREGMPFGISSIPESSRVVLNQGQIGGRRSILSNNDASTSPTGPKQEKVATPAEGGSGGPIDNTPVVSGGPGPADNEPEGEKARGDQSELAKRLQHALSNLISPLKLTLMPKVELETGTLVPNDDIYNERYWELKDHEWRLNNEGLNHVPLTPHEVYRLNFLRGLPRKQRESLMIFTERQYDQAGRPYVGWDGETKYGKSVNANFEIGATWRAIGREENMITPEEYEQFRDMIGKIDRGLLLFTVYIGRARGTLEQTQSFLKLATRDEFPIDFFSNQEIIKYVKQFLPAFGMYKYLNESGGLTVSMAREEDIEEGGHRVINADDILGQWLLQEQLFSPEVRMQGRKVISSVMMNFEAGSPYDSAWVASNRDIMRFFESEAISKRREFSGRYSAGGSIFQMIREDMLRDQRRRQKQIVSPW